MHSPDRVQSVGVGEGEIEEDGVEGAGPGCLEAGWEAQFRLLARLQPAVVEAWAYDVRRGTACRLEGSYRVAE